MTLVCQNMALLLASNYPIAYIESGCSISFSSHFGRTTRGSTPTRQPANANTLPSWHLPGAGKSDDAWLRPNPLALKLLESTDDPRSWQVR